MNRPRNFTALFFHSIRTNGRVILMNLGIKLLIPKWRNSFSKSKKDLRRWAMVLLKLMIVFPILYGIRNSGLQNQTEFLRWDNPDGRLSLVPWLTLLSQNSPHFSISSLFSVENQLWLSVLSTKIFTYPLNGLHAWLPGRIDVFSRRSLICWYFYALWNPALSRAFSGKREFRIFSGPLKSIELKNLSTDFVNFKPNLRLSRSSIWDAS